MGKIKVCKGMQRLTRLNNYQKGLLVVLLVMALIFAVIYPKILSKIGYRYHNAMLVQTQENGNTVYTGKIKWKQAQFIVADNTIVFHYGEESYGPFTIKEDPTAVPDSSELAEHMIGIEIRNPDKVVFRGGVLKPGNDFFNEDGTRNYGGTSVVSGEVEGNDSIMPDISIIYELLNNPTLTHQGLAFAWFVAVFVSIVHALSILFIDELFRFKLAFEIRGADTAKPSDWKITSRYIRWTTSTILIFMIYIIGLL